MEPDFGLTVGAAKTGRPRPSRLVRLTEMAGMIVILWGIGIGPVWLALIGGAMVIGSYAAYRRKHGRFAPGDGGAGDDGGGHSGGD